MVTAKFLLGHTVATKGIMNLFDEVELSMLLARHVSGDWGDLSDEDKLLNSNALTTGNQRLFSVYTTDKGRVWVITEADRSVTTLLLPVEY